MRFLTVMMAAVFCLAPIAGARTAFLSILLHAGSSASFSGSIAPRQMLPDGVQT